jgi:hypothetical protein
MVKQGRQPSRQDPTGNKKGSGDDSDASQPSKFAKTTAMMDMADGNSGTGSTSPALGSVVPQVPQVSGAITLEHLAGMLQRMDLKLDTVTNDLTATKSQVAALATTVNDHKKENDARFEALERAVAVATEASTAPLAWTAPAAARSSAPSASRGAAAALGPVGPQPSGASASRPSQSSPGTRRSSRAPSASPADARGDLADTVKVLFLGFGRLRPRAALERHWNGIKEKCPNKLTDGTKLLAGAATMYSVLFPTLQQAIAFRNYVRDQKVDVDWHGTREGDVHTIGIKIEQDPETTMKGRLLSPHYKVLEPLVKASVAWQPHFRFYCNPRRGLIAVEADEELHAIVTLHGTDGATRLLIDEAAAQMFGIPEDVIKNIQGE